MPSAAAAIVPPSDNSTRQLATPACPESRHFGEQSTFCNTLDGVILADCIAVRAVSSTSFHPFIHFPPFPTPILPTPIPPHQTPLAKLLSPNAVRQSHCSQTLSAEHRSQTHPDIPPSKSINNFCPQIRCPYTIFRINSLILSPVRTNIVVKPESPTEAARKTALTKPILKWT